MRRCPRTANGRRLTPHDQEDDGHPREQDAEGDLVGGLLPLGALHEGDHAVEEAPPGSTRDRAPRAVGEHLGAPGHRAAVAAGLADHGADSPVMADSSTEAIPSITLPSPG